MQYRRLGNTGLQVSALSIGGYLTFGSKLDNEATREILKVAVEHGVNLIDLADSYAGGGAERAVGACMGEFKRTDLVLSTKVFWPLSDGANDRGLSRKHIMESVERSLTTLRTDYLDLYFCHRVDNATPFEETARAMGDLVRQGKVLYWGVSVYPPRLLHQAHRQARRMNLYPPAVEQPPYNLCDRGIERWMLPSLLRLGMGLVVFSPLAGGLLSGKYAEGTPDGSRARTDPQFLPEKAIQADADRVRRLVEIADSLGCTPAQLAIAWLLHRPFVSSVITGASSPAQLVENLGALDVEIPEPVMADLKRLFPLPRLRLSDVVRLLPLLASPRKLRTALRAW